MPGRVMGWTVLSSLVLLALAALVNAQPVAASVTEERIVFGRACDSFPEEVWFVDETGSRLTELTHVEPMWGVRLSPVGAPTTTVGELLIGTVWNRGLAFASVPNPNYVSDVTSFPPAFSGSGSNVAWSSSDVLAYVGDDGTGPAVWTRDFGSEGDSKLVTFEDGDRISGIDWSPDGSKLIYSRAAASGVPMIYSVTAEGSIVELLGPGIRPRWSPDGTRIAFQAGDGSLTTMAPDGSEILSLGQVGLYPVWSPNGDRLAFRERSDGIDHVSVIDLADKSVERVYSGTVACDDVLAVWDWGPTQVPRFDDVPFDHTFYNDVDWLAEESITKGCGTHLFCPGNFVTRGEMAAFVVRALGYTDNGGGNLFLDDDDSIFENDIDKLGTAGVTKGCNPPANDRFCPDALVTRGAMAAFLVRALGYTDNGGGNLFIDDDGSIFENDIDKLATAGVTKGCNPPVNDKFCPDDFVTRGAMAAFLHRALD